MPLSSCDEWPGYTRKDGYGRRYFRRKYWLAHRAAWVEAFGEIPEGLFVCHRCDNRACRALEHLFLGTAAENSADMVRKGRSLARRQPLARLSRRQVIEIRCLRGLLSQKRLAAIYGVNQSQISRATTEDRWKCAPISL